MLTTTLDGLWVLQVLSGIETVCPELQLRSYFPRYEDAQLAIGHPVVGKLTEDGAIVHSGGGPIVDEPIKDWLSVISRRDIAIIIEPGGSTELPLRVALSRLGRWWVSMARFSAEDRKWTPRDTIRVRPMGTARTTPEASELIARELRNLCGECEPAEVRPFALPTEKIKAVKTAADVERILIGEGVDADQMRAAQAITDAGLSASASIVALQSGPKAPDLTDQAVTIVDTAKGRIMISGVTRGKKTWTQITAGTPTAILTAVTNLLNQLPAQGEWATVRNALG